MKPEWARRSPRRQWVQTQPLLSQDSREIDCHQDRIVQYNGFVWLYRLLQAAGKDVADILGLRMDIIVPVVGLSLIATALLAYITILRRGVIQERWCRPCRLEDETVEAAITTTSCCCSCLLLIVRDTIVGLLQSHDTLLLFIKNVTVSGDCDCYDSGQERSSIWMVSATRLKARTRAL
jgi:hypothetical protein